MTQTPVRDPTRFPRAEPEAADVVIRPLSTAADFRACVALQKQTWGENFTECVPPTILKVSQRIGGVCAGALDGEGRLLGFVFGLAGFVGGEAVHWSDMLAVRPEARNLGLAQRLKGFQAETVRAQGVARIYWTFDPLVARNAHLNLNRLGARVVEYEPDMYGSTDSDLHRLGTDRFVVAWEVFAERDGAGHDAADHEAAGRGGAADDAAGIPAPLAGAVDAPVLNAAVEDGGAGELGAEVVRIEVPLDIEAVQRVSLDDAVRWRQTTRAAFMEALGQGYSVTGFYRETRQGPCYYVLSRPVPNQDEVD